MGCRRGKNIGRERKQGAGPTLIWKSEEEREGSSHMNKTKQPIELEKNQESVMWQ
jgi:hypothetical protein